MGELGAGRSREPAVPSAGDVETGSQGTPGHPCQLLHRMCANLALCQVKVPATGKAAFPTVCINVPCSNLRGPVNQLFESGL